MQRSSEVLDVKAVSVNGIVSYDDGLYLLNYRLDYTITLPSSRSMQPVDVHQVEDVSEVFVESADLHAKEDLVKENLAFPKDYNPRRKHWCHQKKHKLATGLLQEPDSSL